MEASKLKSTEGDTKCEETVKRPQFGGRVLGDGDDVFKHNAWDNVQWDESQETEARKSVEEAAAKRVDAEKAVEYEEKADIFWDKFYGIHQNRFFKNRNWIFTEFPDLAPGYTGAPFRVFSSSQDTDEVSNGGQEHSGLKDSGGQEDSFLQQPQEASTCPVDLQEVEVRRKGEDWMGQNSDFRVLEVGCGTGSTVFPILQINTNPGLIVYCCDLSETAVNLVKDHKDYSQRRCCGFVCDVTRDWQSIAPFPHNTIDIVTLIFVLSAVHPDKMADVAKNIFRHLKPGGKLLFRDYGRYDMAQLRFKPGKCIQDNFYVRGDGTRCYFFTQEEITRIFTEQGFRQEQNIVDRRLQVNRGKKLKMYRVWIQAKFVKPETEES